MSQVHAYSAQLAAVGLRESMILVRALLLGKFAYKQGV